MCILVYLLFLICRNVYRFLKGILALVCLYLFSPLPLFTLSVLSRFLYPADSLGPAQGFFLLKGRNRPCHCAYSAPGF